MSSKSQPEPCPAPELRPAAVPAAVPEPAEIWLRVDSHARSVAAAEDRCCCCRTWSTDRPESSLILHVHKEGCGTVGGRAASEGGVG